MRFYLLLISVVTTFLGYEYWALINAFDLSFLVGLQKIGIFPKTIQLNAVSGGDLSIFLGWLGISLMILMNVYSLRKRGFFFGKLSHWLNFHIFCGLLGPILIFFHCELKARGIVGISFWSMIVSLMSGIIGKYLYRQVLMNKNQIENLGTRWEIEFSNSLAKFQISEPQENIQTILKNVLSFAGVSSKEAPGSAWKILIYTIIGDLRLLLLPIPTPRKWPINLKRELREFAFIRRKALHLSFFQRVLGHWHSLHVPFAFFMYGAAFVHIISSLIFQKKLQ